MVGDVHSDHMEPVKGGIRFDIDSNLEEVERASSIDDIQKCNY